MGSKWDAGEQESDTTPAPAAKGGMPFLFWSVLAIIAGSLFAYLLFFGAQGDAGKAGGKATTRLGREHAAVGSQLTGLFLEPLTGNGEPVSLAELKGQVVLVNYWGTWCPPCRIEFPQLVALERHFRDETEFRYLSVSCGGGADEDKAELNSATEDFLRVQRAGHPTYFDADGKSRVALVKSAKLRDFGYPTTVLLDREGVIRALWSGYDERYDAEMYEAVREVLEEGK